MYVEVDGQEKRMRKERKMKKESIKRKERERYRVVWGGLSRTFMK